MKIPLPVDTWSHVPPLVERHERVVDSEVELQRDLDNDIREAMESFEAKQKAFDAKQEQYAKPVPGAGSTPPQSASSSKAFSQDELDKNLLMKEGPLDHANARMGPRKCFDAPRSTDHH